MKKLLMILITGMAITLFAAGDLTAQVEGMDLHGFISQGYLSTTENYFTPKGEGEEFAFNEVGINFGQELTDQVRIGIQLFTRDFSDSNNSDIKIDWAFCDYHFQDWLGLRFGQMKTPHGLYNEIRDIDMLRNPIFLPESIYQELSHDIYINDIFLALQGISSRDLFLSLQGLGLYGYIDLNLIGGLSYQVMYGTQNLDTGTSKTIEKAEHQLVNWLENEDIEVDYKYAGNVLWDTPMEGLRFGLSLDNIKMSANSRLKIGLSEQDLPGETVSCNYEKMENWVGSLEFTWDNLVVMAEYLHSSKEYKVDLPSRTLPIESEPTGWYVGGSYRFLDWFELGGYYSKTDVDNEDYLARLKAGEVIPHPDFFYEFRDIAITTRFDINEYWAIKLEVHNMEGIYTTTSSGTGAALNYEKVEEDWYLYVAKMTVAF